MGTGAVIVAAAAAKRRRTNAILDAFRLAGATAPERATSTADLGLSGSRDLDDLMTRGVIVAGSRGGTWYLSEAAFVEYRDARPARAMRVLSLVLLALTILGAALLIGIMEQQR
ncbi:MAG: hypothetical protein ABIV10_04990 [Gemmatimonadaceae bacterium]